MNTLQINPERSDKDLKNNYLDTNEDKLIDNANKLIEIYEQFSSPRTHHELTKFLWENRNEYGVDTKFDLFKLLETRKYVVGDQRVTVQIPHLKLYSVVFYGIFKELFGSFDSDLGQIYTPPGPETFASKVIKIANEPHKMID